MSEADALVQLTRILCEQISAIANLFGDRLNEFKDDAIKEDVNSSITTIFLEVSFLFFTIKQIVCYQKRLKNLMVYFCFRPLMLVRISRMRLGY